MKTLLIGIVLTVLMMGCETPTGPGDCPNKVMLWVEIKDPPVFSWDSSCSVDGIIVYQQALSSTGLQTLVPVWSINADQLAISSPISYGINPLGIEVIVPAKPLIEGETYTVKVLRYINEIPGLDIIGETEFKYVLP